MDFWVFGYGSLLWNPGFAPVETVAARADGWHRSFCMLSIHHRGTEDDPGLVLALDAAPGASCAGLAMRVPASSSAGVLAMLRARELVSSAYLERHLPVELADGRMVTALSYVIDPDHRQYCRFEPEVQARMIARARGGRERRSEPSRGLGCPRGASLSTKGGRTGRRAPAAPWRPSARSWGCRPGRRSTRGAATCTPTTW
jgi:cation transport protein ChaC